MPKAKTPTSKKPKHEAEVLIIGGGATGCGIMRDLALRGIRSILIDSGDLNSGTSGANHGLLHSGGRYVANDAETAAECRRESEILRRVMPQCIDDCGGLFVAVEGDDPEYAERFADHCKKADIECEALSPFEAREMEPAISERAFAAYAVRDATIDPFRLTIEQVNHAGDLAGSTFLPHTQAIGFDIKAGRISAVDCLNTRTGEPLTIHAAQIVNAAGVWAKEVAGLAGCACFNLLYSKGTLAIASTRLTQRVVNRLRPPGDGDILVPGGTVSILGTTSDRIDDLSAFRPTAGEVDRNIDEGSSMIPALAEERFIRAYSGVRALITGIGETDGTDDSGTGRQVSRGYALFDHAEQGVDNFATITGGKLTTFRLMAEKTSDLIARRLGNDQPCSTSSEPLPTAEKIRWTEPGYSARHWIENRDMTDPILCECEMVPRSVVDSVLADSPGAEPHMPLKAIALRSRIGKGACQGSFCALRVTSHLYDREIYSGDEGLGTMREFLAERYKGIRPVMWGKHMPQAELAETLHCGLMGLDLLETGETGDAGAKAGQDKSNGGRQ